MALRYLSIKAGIQHDLGLLMRLNNNMKGAALMTGCVFAYVINDALMKFIFFYITNIIIEIGSYFIPVPFF